MRVVKALIVIRRWSVFPYVRSAISIGIGLLLSGCNVDNVAIQWNRVLDISPEFRLMKVVADDDLAVTSPDGRDRGVQLIPRKAGRWTTVAILLIPASSPHDGQRRQLSVVCRLLSQRPGNQAKIIIQQLRGESVQEKYYPLLPGGGKRMEDGGVVGNKSGNPVAIGRMASEVELQTKLHPEAEQVQVFLEIQSAEENSVISVQSITAKLAEDSKEGGSSGDNY